MAATKFTKSRCMLRVNLLAVELGDQDVKDGMQNRLGGAFQEVRDPYPNSAFPQADGVIEIGKREELNCEIRNRRAGTKFTVG